MTSAASRFLQTAVIVDDEAFSGVSKLVGELVDPNSSETIEDFLPPVNNVDEAQTAIAEDDRSRHRLDIEGIIGGFADAGIVCGALAPDSARSIDVERVQRLAVRSDIVILDWKLGSASGVTTNSLAFLSAILADDLSRGGRLRLVCIYTGETDLKDIASQIVERLRAEGYSPSVSDLTITVGYLRVLVLRKRSVRGFAASDSIEEDKLAGTLVAEFEAFAGVGLLPKLTLDALSALRDNAHRVLTRFGEHHDPAFLSHRAMTTGIDTEQFALGMLSEEFGAVIATADVAVALESAEVKARVWELITPLSMPRPIFKPGKEHPSTELTDVQTVALFDDEPSPTGVAPISVKAYKSVTSLMVGETVDQAREESKELDLGFSVLSSLVRDSEYDGEQLPPPGLFLGAVLRRHRKLHEPEYFLCVQPLCDAIRLDGPTSFPLLPLASPTPEQSKFDLVVRDQRHFVCLSTDRSRFREVEMEKFSPDSTRSVSATWVVGQGWQFISTRKTRYQWLGHLRPTKAQIAVTNMATKSSRIGIDEYEYLRR